MKLWPKLGRPGRASNMVVVLDCNIWITLTINSELDFIAGLFENETEIASCDTLKGEILDVLNRPRLRKYINPSEIVKVTELHDLVTTYYKPGKLLKVTTDPKDHYLFALSVKSKADFLVTGDKLLLAVGRFKNTGVISLGNFRSIASNP